MTGRYEIVTGLAPGEQAGADRVSRVYEGRDVDLGRRVVLKVLDEQHAGDREVVQRFVEEAQIGGQLQHPGIVPVYELGVLDGRQPFFASRLVKGRSLAELLADRPAADRHALLAAFEQICRALAYAHSRGVYHRSLRPSKVVIGRFGEALIVDWGDVRVRGRGGVADEARTREDRERDDERTDVLSLGAILAGILIGAAVDTEDPSMAREALDRCGAEADLVDLAGRCLAPDPGDRPRDASAVARAIGVHLAAVEERAHRFAVEAAESQAEAARAQREIEEQGARAATAHRRAEEEKARAAEQRRSRKQTIVLAAAILFALIVGAGGYAWIQADRHRRAEAAARRVDRAIEEARRHEGTRAWSEAFSAARTAEEIASSEDADEETKVRARGLATRLAAAKATADEAAEREAADHRMRTRLESVFLRRAVQWNARRLDEDLRQAFRDHGIDVLALEPEEAAARIRESAIAEDLSTALDQWAGVRRLVGDWEEGAPWRLLLDIADRADDDPARDRLRAAIRGLDVEAIEAYARDANLDDLPPRTLRLVGLLLPQGLESRIAFLRRCVIRHPGDLHLRAALTTTLLAAQPPRYRQAGRHAAAVVALAPDRAGVWMLQAYMHLAGGRVDEAIASYRRAIDLDPSYPSVYSALAAMLRYRGEHEEADRLFRRQIDVLRERLRDHPDDWLSRVTAAMAHARLGDVDGVLGLVREEGTEGAVAASRMLLGHVHRARGDLEAAIVQYERVVAAGLDGNLDAPRFQIGLCRLESGRYAAAAEAFRAASDTIEIAKGAAAAAESLARLDGDLDAIVRGDRVPADAAEAVLFARLCYYEGRFAASARWYARAFTDGADPRGAAPFIGHGYQAAIAAARAAAGIGTDGSEPPESPAVWRERATRWLESALAGDAARVTLLTHITVVGLDFVLPPWFLVRRDFACVRDETSLSRLPEEERRAWRETWARLDALLPRPADR